MWWERKAERVGRYDIHVVLELLQVSLLLPELLLELQELFLLALADSEILVDLLALLEGIAVGEGNTSVVSRWFFSLFVVRKLLLGVHVICRARVGLWRR